jgi:hypothetical protein
MTKKGCGAVSFFKHANAVSNLQDESIFPLSSPALWI